ncbi:hypothetical protein ACFPRL_24320 [Pseudoclavibacter helvolus]
MATHEPEPDSVSRRATTCREVSKRGVMMTGCSSPKIGCGVRDLVTTT